MTSPSIEHLSKYPYLGKVHSYLLSFHYIAYLNTYLTAVFANIYDNYLVKSSFFLNLLVKFDQFVNIYLLNTFDVIISSISVYAAKFNFGYLHKFNEFALKSLNSSLPTASSVKYAESDSDLVQLMKITKDFPLRVYLAVVSNTSVWKKFVTEKFQESLKDAEGSTANMKYLNAIYLTLLKITLPFQSKVSSLTTSTQDTVITMVNNTKKNVDQLIDATIATAKDNKYLSINITPKKDETVNGELLKQNGALSPAPVVSAAA